MGGCLLLSDKLLAEHLGMCVSPTTILRRLMALFTSPVGTVSVLSIDDWSFRRGRKCGTILVDLTTHAIIDLDRVIGRFNFGATQHDTAAELHQLPTTDAAKLTGNEQISAQGTSAVTDPNSATQRAQRNGGMFGSGAPSLLRLLNEPLGGQIAWLLPLALLGILALAWQRRPRFQIDCQQHSLLLWGLDITYIRGAWRLDVPGSSAGLVLTIRGELGTGSNAGIALCLNHARTCSGGSYPNDL